MKHFKKAIAIAATGAAMALASAPANAALTISYPVGASSGFFGDASIAPGTSYDESAVFTTGTGTGTFSITSTTAFFNISSAYLDGVAFSLTSPAPGFTFGSLVTGLSSGTHTLRVVGSVDAMASSTGSYGGQINFVPGTAVPEPATWAMMIGGVGFTGGALRRRAKRDAGKLALA